jgi:hypothetical protein
VKTLRTFRKSFHTPPDAVNATTSAFLAKLCVDELAEEGERFFQTARTLFAYKRKDVSLDIASPAAVLASKDFTLEIAYALDESDPGRYVITRALHSIRNANFLATAECESAFGGLFTEIVFALTKGAPVEAVIDAIENLADGTALAVTYPSDCSHCMLAVVGVSAEVRFDGAELAMIFPRAGSPQALLEGFHAVRHAFVLSKDKTLAGLLK